MYQQNELRIWQTKEDIKLAGVLVVKAQMIDLLKEKLRNGVAHFLYMKKDGTLREAWGTCLGNLMRATQNGRGLLGAVVEKLRLCYTQQIK